MQTRIPTVCRCKVWLLASRLKQLPVPGRTGRASSEFASFATPQDQSEQLSGRPCSPDLLDVLQNSSWVRVTGTVQNARKCFAWRNTSVIDAVIQIKKLVCDPLTAWSHCTPGLVSWGNRWGFCGFFLFSTSMPHAWWPSRKVSWCST